MSRWSQRAATNIAHSSCRHSFSQSLSNNKALHFAGTDLADVSSDRFGSERCLFVVGAKLDRRRLPKSIRDKCCGFALRLDSTHRRFVGASVSEHACSLASLSSLQRRLRLDQAARSIKLSISFKGLKRTDQRRSTSKAVGPVKGRATQSDVCFISHSVNNKVRSALPGPNSRQF